MMETVEDILGMHNSMPTAELPASVIRAEAEVAIDGIMNKVSHTAKDCFGVAPARAVLDAARYDLDYMHSQALVRQASRV